MKKNLIVVSLILVTLIVSGCGCNKKEKVLECSSELDEYGEKKIIYATFENNYLKNQKIETITVFGDEMYANRFFEMYKDSDDYVVLKNGLEVSLEQTVENDSTDDIFKYENFYNSMLENNFKCKNK